MIKNKNIIVNLMVLLFLFPNCSIASSTDHTEDEPIKWTDFQRHWYFGGQLGNQFLTSKLMDFDLFTGRGFIGYHVTPHLSIETHLALSNDFEKSQIETEGVMTQIVTTRASFIPEVDILIKSSFELTDEIIVFAKAGIGAWRLKFDGNVKVINCNITNVKNNFSFKEIDVFFIGAIGMSLQLTDMISVDGTMYYSYSSDIGERYIPTIGLTYHII